MSKSVLVMDTPEKCDDCNIRAINLAWCQAERKSTSHYSTGKPMDERKRPDWCPLKPIPEKISEEELDMMATKGYDYGYFDGWNACVDKIIGYPDCEGCLCPTCKDGCENAGYEPNTCQNCEGQAVKTCIKHK